jgi:hypothetical protein
MIYLRIWNIAFIAGSELLLLRILSVWPWGPRQGIHSPVMLLLLRISEIAAV